MDQLYLDFLSLIPDEIKPFVDGLDNFLEKNNCKRTIKPTAKGYLVSYTLPSSGKALMNFVFRKGCVRARIYAAHIAEYEELLEQFPATTKKEIAGALDCKKLTGKTCSPTCPAGYTFKLDGVEHKKCRSMAFLSVLCNENNPILQKMIEKEVECSA